MGDFEKPAAADQTTGPNGACKPGHDLCNSFLRFISAIDAGLVVFNVPFAIVGGSAVLLITHVNFSISAGFGLIALFGICIQNGIILISVF